MKPARIIVLIIALAAGGIAAFLASRTASSPPQAPVAQIETVEVLVANNEIGIGSGVQAQDFRWQPWHRRSTAFSNHEQRSHSHV